MIRINQIKTDIDADEKVLIKKAASVLKIRPEDIKELHYVKKSIDARKSEVKYVYCIDVKTDNEDKIIKKSKNNNVMKAVNVKYRYRPEKSALNNRPVIVGSGPAGLFCAYMLTNAGYNPIVIERGADVDTRTKKVNSFWNNNELDICSNVQFGEGGAGTFSDGKLNTLVKDNNGRGRYVLETFVEYGAPSEITYINKPHIGTDKLKDVIKNMREYITSHGGEYYFETQLTDIIIEDNKVKSIIVNNDKRIDTDVLVLAIGHSARDTFELLDSCNFKMSPKAFAIGLRIEHPQEMISRHLYKDEYNKLPPADYKFTHKASNQRGIYSFCMCPGGFVVNASSENKMIAVNGMSNYKRDEMNANSALIVTVTPQDFENEGTLAGVEFQRKWERLAYMYGKGNVPIQLYGDFCQNKDSLTLGAIRPNIKGKYTLSNLNMVLPNYVCDAIKEGVTAFDRRIEGFANEEAILSGVETRTSSPVRIERDDRLVSNIEGVYPCGEGAGYAGGIMSAAIDGIKVYEAITTKY